MSLAASAQMLQLTPAEHVALHELVSRYAFIVDDAAWDRLGEVFTEDAICDFNAVCAMPVLRGLPAITEYFAGMEHPVAHYALNIVCDAGAEVGRASLRCKQFAVLRSGKLILGEYRDQVALTPAGWRFLERRALSPRAFRLSDA